jgi:hypothetical protein
MLHSKPKIQHKCVFFPLHSNPNIPLRIILLPSLSNILPYLQPAFTRRMRGIAVEM